MYNNKLKVFAQAQEQKLIDALASTREHSGPHFEARNRDDYQRDYARILYSSSFRRLQGKMQLFEVDPEKFNRNRLTHSLEVAQIARGIASDLELVHPVVVELAALAHDIGNPPFGHSGEKLLNELSEDIGGYEGNAQALRILRRLEKKYADCSGLNLTHRSLLSVVKYPNSRSTSDKFIYDDDFDFYTSLLAKYQLNLQSGEKTIDAQIMVLADEIAYAAHDLEDALSRNMVTIEDIEYEFLISGKFQSALGQFRKIVNKSKKTAFQANSLKTSEEFAMIFRKELTSNIVNRLVTDISIIKNENGFRELGFGKLNTLSEGLKKLLFKVIMRKRNILTYEFRGNVIIRDLYVFYNKDENYKFLSPELKFSLPEKKLIRLRPRKSGQWLTIFQA
nr:dNTP triphosphohydrolase [Limnobaculum xujianqingii]